MARKSPINHAVTALFSITGKDLASQLADFCSLKKLAWSPDVKIAMVKKTGGDVGDAALDQLQALPVQRLQDILADLLKPIKQHQLFDLADWLRDLSCGQIPDYLQQHWSNNRVPKALDDLMKTALAAGVQDDDIDAVELQAAKRGAKKPALTLVADSDEAPKGADAQLNGFGIPLKESAVDALRDKGMSDKMRWQRVNMYVKALMPEYGFRFRSSPKRETEDGKKNLSRMTYFIEERDDGPPTNFHGFIEHMERTFGAGFDSYEEPAEDRPITNLKVWFKHA